MLPETAEQDMHISEGDAEALDGLRLRVQRLEEMVAALQDTRQLEERLFDKLAKTAAPREEARRVEPAPATAVTVRPPTPVIMTPPADESPWLLLDSLADFTAIWRMFFDLRYRFAWTTRLIVYGLLTIILTSHLWFAPSWIWGLGSFVDKLLALVLAFFIYKALSREVKRYRLFVQINPR